jgi:hypothetical protein
MKLTLGIVVLILALACGKSDVVDPGPQAAPGSVRGTVELLGNAGDTPLSGELALFASLADLEKRRVAYRSPLVLAHGRTYGFELRGIAAGRYFVTACFAFGCGEYRDQESGEPIGVSIGAGSTTELVLAF